MPAVGTLLGLQPQFSQAWQVTREELERLMVWDRPGRSPVAGPDLRCWATGQRHDSYFTTGPDESSIVLKMRKVGVD